MRTYISAGGFQALAATHKIYQRGTPEGERAFFRTHSRDFRVNVTRVFIRQHFIQHDPLSSADFLIGIWSCWFFSPQTLPQSFPHAPQKFF